MSNQNKDIHCLALDGGGIRGILELIYLQELERKTKKRVHELFHTVTGTSTGGLISLLLTVPSKEGKVASAAEALEIYKSLASRIFFTCRFFSLSFVTIYFFISLILSICLPFFVQLEKLFPYADLLHKVLILTCIIAFGLMCKYFSKPVYSPKGLESFCEEYFGKKRTLKDAVTNVGVVAVNIEKERPFVFNSMRARLDPQCSLHNAEIARIARSTSAAPSYFPPVSFNINYKNHLCGTCSFMTPWWDPRPVSSKYDKKIMIFEDGGTKANNPSALCLDLAKWKLTRDGYNPADFNIRLLSIGTGELNPIYKKEKKVKSISWYNPAIPDGGLDHVLYRLLGNDVFNVTTNSQNVHVDMTLLYELTNKEEDYQRVQFEISPDQLEYMDDISEKNILSLVQTANKTVEEHFDKTLKFIQRAVHSNKNSRKDIDTNDSEMNQPRQDEKEDSSKYQKSKKVSGKEETVSKRQVK